LAVLKIQADNLIPAEWGDSDQMQVGSIVWAIGSPFGLAQTVTSGIISAKNRFDPRAPNLELLQTDAAVNPGNSGGPLVDSMGRVVGINTSIHGPEFRGISFAVPSVQAKFVYEQIMDRGYVSRGLLGAYLSAVDQWHAERFDLPDIDGALLTEIEHDSPAMRCGLRVNDVVRSWDGNPIDDFNTLFRYVSMTTPESIAQVDIIRNGRLHSVQVQVGSRSNSLDTNSVR
jgi:S1-C subfamily serine protease